MLRWLPMWLVWLLPVPLTTLAAVAWAGWVSRDRPVRPAESVREHERFRAALAAPLPAPRRRR